MSIQVTCTAIGTLAEAATLSLDRPVVLLAGPNGAGKSTLLRALGAALASDKCPITSKPGQSGAVAANARYMLRRRVEWASRGDDAPPEAVRSTGARVGTVEISGPEVERCIEWRGGSSPTASLTGTTGGAWNLSRLAAGLDRFSDLPEKVRYDMLAELLQVRATRDELAKACPAATLEPLDRVAELVGEGRWDEALALAEEGLTAAKAQWRTITGKPSWSATAGQSWAPEHGMPPDRANWTEAHLARLQHDARAAKAKAAAAPLPVTPERAAEIRACAAELGKRRTAAAQAATQVEQAEADLREARLALERLPAPGAPAPEPHPCPACRVPLVIDGDLIRIAAAQPDPEEQERRAKAWHEARAAVDKAQAVQGLAASNARASDSAVVRAEEAVSQLGSLTLAEQAGAEAEATAALIETGKALAAWINAGRWHRQIATLDQLRAALRPDGDGSLRAEILKRGLVELNRRLYRLSRPMGADSWIGLDEDDLAIAMAGRPWAIMSLSERWLADAVLAMVLAQYQGAPMVLLDGMDILDKDGRANFVFDVLAAVGQSGMAVVVTSTSVRDETPDLAALGLGRTYWIEAGRAAPFTTLEAQRSLEAAE
jgi:energy-coupling factor transporter ATP-binding protein EcfA2